MSLLASFKPSVTAEEGGDMPDIMEFVVRPDFLNRGRIYPRQATLLKLIFLRDDLFTDYDEAVLGQWADGFRLVEPDEYPEPDDVDDILRFESRGGLARGLTPDWDTRLKMCKEEGRSWFREIIPIIGRRGSKGHIGGLSGSYVLWNYLQKYDPQEFYGIDRDKKLMGIVFAGKKEQAKANQWRDLVNVITGAPCFRPFIESSLGETLTIRSPHDQKRIEELRDAGIKTSMDMATFEIVPKESTLMAGRGPTSFMQFYDEMGHVIATGANRSAEDVYEAATPSLDQFGVDAFLYEGSSPWQMTGQLYENYLQALSVDAVTRLPLRPEMLMVQLASWDLYEDWDIAETIPMVPGDHTVRTHIILGITPKLGKRPTEGDWLGQLTEVKSIEPADEPGKNRVEVERHSKLSRWQDYDANHEPVGEPRVVCFPTFKKAIQTYDTQMRRIERANPDTFRVERLSQWAAAMDAYLDFDQIQEMFAPWEGRTLHMQEQGILSRSYVAHGDPSKSGANFGFAIAHTEGPDDEGLYHVVFDKIHAWHPSDYEDSRIDYIAIEKEIIDFGKAFMPSDLTFDQFNSAGMIQRIQRALNAMRLPKRVSVYERTATAPINWKMAETFKTALNMGLIHAPYFELAELELRFLQLTAAMRVDHQTSGPVQTKDVADAMFNVVYSLIGEQMGAFLKQELGNLSIRGSQAGGFKPSESSGRQEQEDQAVFSALSGNVRSGAAAPFDRGRFGRR